MLSRRTADIGVAAILIAVGVAQFVGGLTMDRLEIRRIHPASIPGLVPMALGAAMAVAAALLTVQLVRAPRPETSPENTPDDATITRAELSRLALVGGLCLTYALALVGTLHFWAASSLFIFAFTALFEPGAATGPRARALRLAATALFAVAMGGAVALLFERGFLVRLP